MAPAQLAKLTTPHLGKVYLRTRLFQALDAARDKPVTWISAPGGSGKTLLVASYLKQNKIKPWWYQVDEGDAELASFFYYLGRLVLPRQTGQTSQSAAQETAAAVDARISGQPPHLHPQLLPGALQSHQAAGDTGL
ncbi:MAG: hypothetical protein OEM48_10935 [Gammaproteobacteria bacterium]|nr:hypothetical protein [Gammaproteobacteria bacterium]